MDPQPHSIIIIGSGPAAWTCAIYAARAGLFPIVYEGAVTQSNARTQTLPLGQLNWTNTVENFPGFPNAVSGPQLVINMRNQAQRFGTVIASRDITSAGLSSRPFHLTDSDGQSVRCHALVIATGAARKTPQIHRIDQFIHRGVTNCLDDITLPRFRNHPVIVLGGGDTAAESALHFARFASRVAVVHPEQQLRASSILRNALAQHQNINIIHNTHITQIVGHPETGMTGAHTRNRATGAQKSLSATGLFIAIGAKPNTDFLQDQLQLDPQGYILLTAPPTTQTTVPGVFAAGEVADPLYRQAITAAATGCQAALDANHWLTNLPP